MLFIMFYFYELVTLKSHNFSLKTKKVQTNFATQQHSHWSMIAVYEVHTVKTLWLVH